MGPWTVIPMSLGRAQVEKIAHLARLRLEETEVADYAGQLSSILDMVQRMNAVDTEGVPPLAHPLDATQRMRADRVTEESQRERLQAGAPLVQDGLYLVPRVIE